MARGGTQVRHDNGGGRPPRRPQSRLQSRPQGGPQARPQGRPQPAGRRLRWLAPAVLGTLLGVAVATVGEAAPGLLGSHGPAAAAAGPAASGTHRAAAHPVTAHRTATPAHGSDPATDAPPSGDPTSGPASDPTGPPAALFAVPARQDRCAAPATGVVTHAPATAARTVALTFDDGPDDGTPDVLDALDAAGVHATFFVIGGRAAQHPELVRRAVTEGHLVGDHTYDHVYPRDVPGGWSSSYLSRELGRTAQVVGDATGRPVCWFRPPGGFRTAALPDAARRMRMTVALWSVDTRDWQVQGAQGVRAAHMTLAAKVDTIVARATDVAGQRHPVVLMHDGGGDRRATALAIPRIVAWYRAHGYEFVRLDGRS